MDSRSLWISLISKTNLPPTGVTEGQLALSILWYIWIARNNLVFSDKDITATESLSKAIAAAREWGSCQLGMGPTSSTQMAPTTRESNCALIKTDVAWNESLKLAGLGWTVEAQNGRSSHYVPAHHVRSPLAAEALASSR